MDTTSELPARLRPLEADLYTVQDLADRLRCSVRHVWRMHDSGALPAAIRIGRLVRWPKPLIDRWIADGCPRVRR